MNMGFWFTPVLTTHVNIICFLYFRFRAENLPQNEKETWILIGDTSRKQPSIHCIK